MRFIPRLLVFLLLLQASPRLFGQVNILFTSDTGLPNSLVNCIAEDTQGRMWIATENGLSLFNGSRFINFYNEKGNPNSLVSNFVRTVCADKSGRMLVGSTAGLQIYDNYRNSFTPLVDTKSIGVNDNNINDIITLRDGGHLVVGLDAFNIYIGEGGKIEARENALTHKVRNIISAAESRDGSLWAIQRPGGVYKSEGKTKKIRHVTDAAGKDYYFQTICEGNDGGVYAGHSESGLYVYDARTHRFNLMPGTERLLQIRDIKPLGNSTVLCIGTDGYGVYLYDTRKKEFVASKFFSDPFLNIASQKVHKIYINNDGHIWLGMYQKGIYVTNTQSNTFEYIGHRSREKNLIGDRCVTSIMQTYNGDVWVTTDNGGLYGIGADGRQLNRYTADSSPLSVPTTMLGLFEDSRHRVWFGSFNRGSGTIDLATGRCNYVTLQGTTGRLYSVYEFAEDKRGQIWAASMGNGILRYDEASHSLSTYVTTDGTSWSTCLEYDRENDVFYAGTYGGVVWFSPTDPKKTVHQVTTCTAAYSINRVSPTLMAFSTTDGLILYDTKKKQISKTITTDDKLPNNNVLSAEMGNDGHLWISCSEGLVRYNLKTMTSESFTVRDGLQGNEFYRNASLVGRDGKLWFGGINGITVFSPKMISNNRKNNLKVRVVSLRADEQYVNPNEDGEYLIPSAVDAFTVELATLPLYMSHRISYSYSLDGGAWETLPAPQNLLTYNNIGYGEHTLSLKTIIDGKDSEITDTVIYVPYPWYLKWWVVLLWIALIAALVYWAQNNIRHRRALNKAVIEHRREEELKETKLQFFMNIVHDLRTPLTLIATPLQKLVTTDDNTRRQHLYSIMSKNTDRLLRLTNEIMDLRKIDRGKMVLRCYYTNVSRFINSVVENTSDIAETRKLEFKATDNTDGNMMAWMDTQSIEKVLINLISNAVKFTEPGGYVHVEWGEEPDGRLYIKIVDTGIGIPEADRAHIFDRFYQVKATEKHVKGTGIGLNLVKSLVELHHGDISVLDNPDGKGTQFVIILPTRKDAYDEDELYEGEPALQNSFAETPEVTNLIQTIDATDDDNSASQGSVSADSSNGGDVVDTVSAVPKSKRKTILIADDDDDIRQFLTEEMAAQYNVLAVPDGKAAYNTLLRSHVDLLISDVMMPNMDGHELCRMIRQNVHHCNLPIILLTAKNSDQDQLEGLQSKADAYVTKPFNLELLQTMVCNLLLRHDSLRNTIKGFEMTAEKITTPASTSADDKLMERLTKAIDANLNNPDLTSDLLAREVGLSRVHLYRKLKELTNQSATSYIRNIRLTKAAELLREKKLTVSETAYLVGFRTPNHFSAAFKELYGVSPKEYANGEG